MPLFSNIKNNFFSTFREFFVHNHGSLQFRAKILALIISVNKDFTQEDYIYVKNIGDSIYKNDEERVKILILSTQELVKKVQDNNGLDTDTLITHIQKELKFAPRYAKKIDVEKLKPLVSLSKDIDTRAYQDNILVFLQNLKDEILHTKKSQIAKDEEILKNGK